MRAVGIVMLAALGAPVVGAVGSWTSSTPEFSPLPRRANCAHRAGSTLLAAEEQLNSVHVRLRLSSAAAGKWLIAKKEKIMTEEEIYAEKVRKFARSIDQVNALGSTFVD